MATVVEKQKIFFEFESEAAASGYFTLKVGDADKTADIPYDAVRYSTICGLHRFGTLQDVETKLTNYQYYLGLPLARDRL